MDLIRYEEMLVTGGTEAGLRVWDLSWVKEEEGNNSHLDFFQPQHRILTKKIEKNNVCNKSEW